MIEPLFLKSEPSPTTTTIEGLNGLWIDEGCVYSNFVSSIDGIVAVEGKSPGFISLDSVEDRLLMGTLRAFADAVVIGAGTLRAEPDHRWEPDFIAPDLSAQFAQLRIELGLDARPRLVVATSSGSLPTAPSLDGGLVVTSAEKAERLARDHQQTEVVSPTEGEPKMTWVLEHLRYRGFSRILVEGGPHLLGQFLQEGCLDEMFLTISPVLLGRDGGKASMLEELDLTDNPFQANLFEVRKASNHLFLRYRLIS